MMPCIITSSVLILAVILIRSMFKKQLSRRLCYALWLIVAVRLLLPFPMLESTASIMNLYPNIHSKVETSKPIADHEIGEDNFTRNSIIVNSEQNITATDTVAAIENNSDSSINDHSDSPNEIFPTAFNINSLLKIIWIAGMILTTLFFLVKNYMFYRYLKKNRVRITDAECRLPVYVIGSLYSPCLYGFFQPSIYLSATNTEDETWKHFILLHEEVHYQHKDHIWALIRSLCLIIHWFNPLVWLAAILSRQDCELACDEGVIKNIGDEQRILYGDMLLSMVAVGNGFGEIFNATTTMKSGKNSLKERIRLIANSPKMLTGVLFLILLLLTSLIACTFTNAREYAVPNPQNNTVSMNRIPEQTPLSTELSDSQTIEPDPEYSFTGGKSNKFKLVVTAGAYPEDSNYLAFEDDFDADGKTEAFILIGSKDNDGISGDLWYVNDSDAATLLLEDIYAEPNQQLFQKTVNTVPYNYFLFTYTAGNAYLTDIYSVWDDAAMLCFDADGFAKTTRKVLVSGEDLIFTDEEYDFNYMKEDEVSAGHTVKYYTYHFLDTCSFEQYTSVEKTENEFLSFEGADTILKRLEAEYHPNKYQFIYRSNGEWDINMVVDNGDNYFFYYAVCSTGIKNSLTLKSIGEGYYRLDLLSNYRDFLQCLLYGDGDPESDWLTLASENGIEKAAAANWYERFEEDGIFQKDSYYIYDLLAKDLDRNGQTDLMLITDYDTNKLSNVEYPKNKHAYIYMNEDSVYELSRKSELIFDWNQSVFADFDQDGYVEIGYSISTGGVGAAGSFEKGLLKYKNHTLELMKLPNDLPEEDNDTGIQISVTAEKGKNQYMANCPYLNRQILFQRNTNSGNDKIPAREGEEVGGNVRGYVNMQVTEKNGEEILTLREYLHGENGINDGIADAVFTIRFDEKDEAYIADFSIAPY